jgi:hypothetical protein
MVKMDIRHKGQVDPGLDFTKHLGGFFVRYGYPNQLTTGLTEAGNLGARSFHVPGVGAGHGLYNHRRAAADFHLADSKPFC